MNTILGSVAMGVSSVGSSPKMLQILFVICSLQWHERHTGRTAWIGKLWDLLEMVSVQRRLHRSHECSGWLTFTSAQSPPPPPPLFFFFLKTSLETCSFGSLHERKETCFAQEQIGYIAFSPLHCALTILQCLCHLWKEPAILYQAVWLLW